MSAGSSDGRRMLLIAAGLTVALVAADLLALQSRRSARRTSRLLGPGGPG